jgi:hypothetical protein
MHPAAQLADIVDADETMDLVCPMDVTDGYPYFDTTLTCVGMHVESYVVSCTEYPYGFLGTVGGKTAPSKITHTFTVRDASDGSVRGVTLLTDHPSADEIRRLLGSAGLSLSGALAVTEGFGIADDGPIVDRAYLATTRPELSDPGLSFV